MTRTTRQPSGGTKWTALGGLLLCTALVAALAAPSVAGAGPARFTYEVCDSVLPGGGTPGAAFAVNPGVAFNGFNTCAQPGGSIGISETGHVNASFSFWRVPIPATPGGKVESIAFSGSAWGAGPGTKAFAYTQGWPANNAGESQRTFQISGFYFGEPWIYLACDGNYTPGCDAGPGIAVHYIAATEVDPVPPKIDELQGSLLEGGVLRGHQTIEARASDKGGGLSKVSISVNGLPAGEPDTANCNLVHTERPTVVGSVAATTTPCPATLEPSWTLDTALYPFHNGENVVQVCASDYASRSEPNTTCSSPQTVDVDDSCVESAVVGGQILSAQFTSSHNENVTVPFNHPAEVSGELADNAGDAVGGATICVEMQTLGNDGGVVPVATATTDPGGHFSYQVPPGPNRHILLAYRHDTFQVARSVNYYAHAKPTLRVRPNKVRGRRRVRISGKLPGPNAAGRVVILQASALHSKRWYTFHRATANGKGIFHSRYRFGATTRTTTYRLRAVIPRQAGYPWETGHSKPVRVKVRVRRRPHRR